MTCLRFAICDDEVGERDYIKELVRKWADKEGRTAVTTCFSSAEAFLFQYADNKDYDILLLDIEMGGLNGIELAKKVRAENKEVQIIFITGYMDYISDGYEVEALHYLIKPISESKLYDVINRAVIKLKRNEKALLVKLLDETVRIPLYDILFFEVQRNYVTIHAVHAKDCITVKSTLSEFEKELDDRFFRAGRSFIVNLYYVRRVTKTDVFLSDGSSIPLPRGLYDKINRAMIERF